MSNKQTVLSVLDEIDNQQDIAFANVMYAVGSQMQKDAFMMEYASDIDKEFNPDIFQEATYENDDDAKPSLLSKIVSLIKSFFKMIKNAIDKIISIFRKKSKKDVTSVNGLIMEVLEDEKLNKLEDPVSWKIPHIDPQYVKRLKRGLYEHKQAKKNKAENDANTTEEESTDDDETVEEFYFDELYDSDCEYFDESSKEASNTTTQTDNGESIRVKIPVGKGSVFTEAMINVPNSDIAVGYDQKNKVFKFFIKYNKFNLPRKVTARTPEGKVTDEVGILDKANAKYALYFILNPNEFVKICDAAATVAKIINNKATSEEIVTFEKTYKKTFNDCLHNANKIKSTRFQITERELDAFQKNLNKAYEDISGFVDTGTNIKNLDKNVVKGMNFIAKKMAIIQQSVILLTHCVTNSLYVNAQFINSIKNVGLLEAFVDKCIKIGMSPKNVAFNATLVADNTISGGVGVEPKHPPIFKTTRAIFYDKRGRVVYKIALNGAGIAANKAEISTSKHLCDMNRADLIAPVIHTWGNDAIIALEKIPDANKNPNPVDIAAYKVRLKSNLKKSGKELDSNVIAKISLKAIHDNLLFDPRYGMYRLVSYDNNVRKR